MVKTHCKTCNSEVLSTPSRVNAGKGKFCSRQCYYTDMATRRGADTPRWRGMKVGYMGLHSWIVAKYGRASQCESCGSKRKKRYEWANLTGKYLRDRHDWASLCVGCHRAYDWEAGRSWDNRLTARQS